MKRLLAVILCLAAMLTMFAGCRKPEVVGPTMNIYIDETYSFDPALAYNDTGAAQILSLVYEGLFTMNEKGKVKKALCSKYKITEEDGYDTILITLGESYWSDGVAVDAEDFIYAWRRIMNPEFKCEAATLLFPVKNAVAVKNGDVSIDDIGFATTGTNEIKIELEKGYDAEAFLANLTSVALYPLRKDVVRSVIDESSWSALAAVMVANGAFYVKEFEMNNYGKEEDPIIVLERNQYFRRSPDSEKKISKYVTPYRLNIFGVSAETAYEKYKSGEYAFISEIPLDQRASLTKDVEMVDNMFTYSYMFNTNKEIFADAKVRKALSLALDRNAIKDIVVFADAADSLVSEVAREMTRKDSFHSAVISTSANMEEAKKLINEAGVKGKSFTLAIYDDPVDIAVAEYCIKVWKELGVSASYTTYAYRMANYTEPAIKTDAEGNKYQTTEIIYQDACYDSFVELYRSGEFDVIAVNYNMLSTDPFAVLAQFAPKYSGGAYDFSQNSEEWPNIPHTSGYSNPEYDKLIDAAHAAGTSEERFENLHKAEELLVRDDAVVVPLYFGKTAYLVSKNIKKLDMNYGGLLVWTKVKDKDYKPTEEDYIVKE
ncbi:MAG: peptide ABC transporter substrate-binding protein [Ruminococcaceae bacterium]|nr:peptide ABC transporter substrate-binding protein [Oscillospiraceae bacterium]